jgi:penicillin amidase
MHLESPESALFNIFWVHLLTETYYDQLTQNLYPRGDHIDSDSMYFLLQDDHNVWWDNANTKDIVEDRDAVLGDAFEKAYQEGVETFGSDFTEWNWGDLHTITFRNPTLGNSGISLIENIFNRGPFPTSGSESVVNKTCWSANEPYQVGCIPALRQIVDLGNLGNSLMIHSLGQSGHPGHQFYDHFINPWRLFEYHPSNWERSDAEAGDHDLLILMPET